jgi:2-polyprenyl-6-hydroxyphenyl methylase/3-demethylubiquinone-9 3-methyltransferase
MKPPVFDADWPADVKALYRHDVQEIWDRSIAPQIWNQYHNQLEIYCRLADLGRPLDILDVGCAQGTLALLLAERGHRVCAVDIRQQFLDYAASRYERGTIRFVCGNVMETMPEGPFDLIFANQIVEHLVYPVQLVARLAAALRPGGRLVVTTPNGDYVKCRLPSFAELGDPARHEHRQFTADGDGHFFAYRAAELVDIFATAGLPGARAEFFESPWISGHMKVRHLHRWLPGGALRSLDGLTLGLPLAGRRLAHQIMVMGRKAA